MGRVAGPNVGMLTSDGPGWGASADPGAMASHRSAPAAAWDASPAPDEPGQGVFGSKKKKGIFGSKPGRGKLDLGSGSFASWGGEDGGTGPWGYPGTPSPSGAPPPTSFGNPGAASPAHLPGPAAAPALCPRLSPPRPNATRPVGGDFGQAKGVTAEENKERLQRLAELLKLPENAHCADCRRSGPTWASVNLGVFLCMGCAGVHRGLGTHVSKVRSCRLDTWLAGEVDMMRRTG